jgi:hypothetical protein
MSLDRLTSILPPQFFEGAPQDVADDEQQPAVEVRLGESAANKPSASSSAYDDQDFDMFSANEEDASSSVTSSSYGWMNNMKPKKYGGSYLVAFLFFLVFVMVISMASVGITVHRQNKSVMMTSNAAIIEDCETKAPTPKRVRALASSPDAAAATAASTQQGGEKNGGEGIEKRLLKGDRVKRGLGVPSPTPVKGDAVVVVPSPTPVERVLGVPQRRLACSPNSVGSTPVGDICTQSPAFKCNSSANSNCASCTATDCPDGVTWICGQDGDTNFNLEKCPSEKPSQQPSESPSESPSDVPSESPSESKQPSDAPSESPSESKQPSSQPSESPSVSTQPSSQPSESPSESKQPSLQPSESPSESKQPSDAPSELPSVSLQPSVSSAPSTVSYFYTL